MNKTIGYVVGEVETHRFTFVTSQEDAPPRLEYVVIRGVKERVDDEEQSVDILAQVTTLRVASQMLDDAHTFDETRTLLASAYRPSLRIRAEASVLGFLYRDAEGRTLVRVPRSTPLPGASVYTAPDDLLQAFFTRNVASGIAAGTLVNRPDVPVRLDPNGLRRHLAIIAQTGAGKSYLSGLLLENLLQLGGTIIVFDPNSDYVRFRLDAKRDKTPFAGRVEVFRVPGVEGRRYPDQEIGGSKEFSIRFSELEVDEICDMAGVSSSASNIRAAIRQACERMEAEGRDYTPEDLVARLYRMAGLEEPEPEQPEQRTLTVVSSNGDDPDDAPANDPFTMHDVLEEKAGVAIPRGPRSEAPVTDELRGGAARAIKYAESLARLQIWGYKEMGDYMARLLEPQSLCVLDLAGLEHTVMQYIVQKTLREVWKRATTGKLTYPVFLVLEEAHHFVPAQDRKFAAECARMINRVAAEGRKFKVFLTVITQRPGKVDPDTLSQCGSQVVMKLTNPEDQRAVRMASESLSENLFSDLPGLNTGEAIVLGTLTRAPCLIRVGQRLSAEGGSDVDVAAELKKAMNDRASRRMAAEGAFRDPPPRDRKEEI